jgi:hypothetical protein
MTPVITNAKSAHFQIASDLAMVVRVVHGSGKVSLPPPDGNPDLTKAQIAELQKALPKCKIGHDFE